MLEYTFWSFFVCSKLWAKSYQMAYLAEVNRGRCHIRFQQAVLKTSRPFRKNPLYNLTTFLNLC